MSHMLKHICGINPCKCSRCIKICLFITLVSIAELPMKVLFQFRRPAVKQKCLFDPALMEFCSLFPSLMGANGISWVNWSFFRFFFWKNVACFSTLLMFLLLLLFCHTEMFDFMYKSILHGFWLGFCTSKGLPYIKVTWQLRWHAQDVQWKPFLWF